MPNKERTDAIPFAILRFEKRRGGSATALEKHHERKKEAYNSNKEINREKTEMNYHIKQPAKGYYYEIQSRIEAAKCRVRRDSVKFVDTFIGGTNSFICGLPPAEQREYFRRAYNFIAGRVGEHNIFAATIHMDETSPHMHLCFVPLTKDNRLTAKEVLGNRESFKKWQDDFYACMSERWPELERGQKAEVTGRKHIPVWLFKQARQLDEQMVRINSLLSDKNPFTASKSRKEAADQLAKWYQGASGFSVTVKTLISGLDELKQGNADLARQLQDKEQGFSVKLSEKDRELFKERKEYNDLAEKYNSFRDFLQSIPAPIYNQLVQRYQELQQFERGQQEQDGYEYDDD